MTTTISKNKRAAWKKITRSLDRVSDNYNVHWNINNRVKLKRVLDNNSEDGMIAMIDTGMDCDCVSWRGVYHMPTPSVSKVVLLENEQQEYAEGPCSLNWGKPSEHSTGRQTRDHIMEAHENGHPHVIYR